MEKEYYTPEINELFIGYECQTIQIGNPKEVWLDSLIDNTSKFIRYEHLIKNKALRTKYLDVSDLELLGFKYNSKMAYLRYEKDEFAISIDFAIFVEDRILTIETLKEQDTPWITTTLFKGVCKSKNELLKILKMINIDESKS